MSNLVALIRERHNLSQLAAHIRNSLNTDIAVHRDYASIVFEIDGPPELPSPSALLAHGNAFSEPEPRHRQASLSGESNNED